VSTFILFIILTVKEVGNKERAVDEEMGLYNNMVAEVI